MKRTVIVIGVIVLTVLTVNWVVSGFADDRANADTAWKATSYNRQVTDCLSGYAPVARVYDFDKMRSLSNAEVSELTGVNANVIGGCR